MEYRELGSTGWKISEISLGAWTIGGDAWGATSDSESLAALHQAMDLGVNFIDTADVYGDGHSEQLVGKAVRDRPGDAVVVATKAGRRLWPHTAAGYNRANLTAFVERSLRNLGTGAVQLLQLHCPPPEVYDRPEVFGILDRLKEDGKILHYGVSVETVDEAERALRYPGVQSVQIIFNMFRPKPAERLFALARERRAGILARVPLASGLLSGRMKPDTRFESQDHRSYNRHGEAFDAGETFSGVDFTEGLAAVEELRALVPEGATMAQLALRWILMFPEVSAAIPGARFAAQARDNARASDLAPLSTEVMARVREVYDRRLRASIHARW